MSELIEIEDNQRMSREEAAAVLRKLADNIARHNELTFKLGNIKTHAAVPDEVEVEVEIEITTDGGSLEVEITW